MSSQGTLAAGVLFFGCRPAAVVDGHEAIPAVYAVCNCWSQAADAASVVHADGAVMANIW